jgi:predicted ABC-type transport system involved in lysophospholipase L1 biosynthesis ATPase subunit
LPDDRLAHFRNGRIGFVFQFPSLLPTLRVVDNVALPALLARGRDSSSAYQRASELLDRLGVSQHLDAYPGEIRPASSAAPPSPALSSTHPRCCSQMSPHRTWMRRP